MRKIALKEAKAKEISGRFEDYKKRADLPTLQNVLKPILKVPQNEKETLLLLQSMISGNHPAIDFIIGGYDDYFGTDAIIEFKDKGILRQGLLEMVYRLSDFVFRLHYPDSTHKIVCWEVGNIKTGEHTLPNGKKCLYEKEGTKHVIKYEGDYIKVYVLKEILNIS